MRKQHGLTLVELLIVLAIVTVLITMVAPNISSILQRNLVVAQVNESSALIQFARGTAINEATTTTVCATTDFNQCNANWRNSMMAFTDVDGNGNRGNNEPLLMVVEAPQASLRVTGPNAAVNFAEDGSASTNASFLFCHQNGDVESARGLYVTLHGRVKTSQDTDNDGVHNDLAGNALVCN